MNNIFKRTLSLLLVLVMCISMLPASALAEDTEEVPEAAENAEQQEDSVKTVTKEELAAGEEPAEESITGEAEEEQTAAENAADNALELPEDPVVTTVASGTCGDNLEWTLDSNGLLTISGSGKMIDCSSSNDVPWYSNRSSIKSVKIDSGVTSIGKYAFCNCTSLTSVEIGGSVTSIGDYAFYYCESLTSVEIPDIVTSIGECAFSACIRMTSINVSTSNSSYSSIDGVLFNKHKTTLICYPGGKSGEYSIPTEVTSIGYCAFSNCTSLTGVKMGDNVTIIGGNAFSECESLVSLEIGDGVTNIEGFAFYDCCSLTSVEIPCSLTSIEVGIFESCTSLTSVEIPDSVTSIGSCAFSWCTSLNEIRFKGSLPQSIGSDSFYNVTSNVYYPCNESSWSDADEYFPDTCVLVKEHGTEIIDKAVNPTCERTGLTEGSHCSLCGEVITEQETIKALGHDYGEAVFTWSEDGKSATAKCICANDNNHSISGSATITSSVKVAPTCLDMGITTYTATVILNGKQYTDSKDIEDIPALDHDLIHHDAQKATCTEAGWEAYDTCSRCEYTTYNEIPALEHDLIHHDAKEPTWTEKGWKEYDTCSRCEYTTYEEIPVKGGWDITYVLCDERAENPNNPDGYEAEHEDITLEAPVLNGFTFDGWYLDEDCTMMANAPQILASDTGEKTFYAKWTMNSYSVKFNSNGGSGSMSALTKKTDADGELTVTNKFKKTGYKLTGWNTEKDGTGESELTIYALAPYADAKNAITLYAQWEPIAYTVKFDANGGVGEMVSQEFTYGTAQTLTANGFTKTGYIFNGWKCGSKAYKDEQEVSNLTTQDGAEVKMTAQWKADTDYAGYTYTISFNGNGNTGGKTADESMKVGTAKALTANGYKKTGYSFAGWATTEGGEIAYTNKQSVKDLNIVLNPDAERVTLKTVVLYAVWNPNTYTVSFNGNGGKVGKASSYTQEMTYDTAAALIENDFTRVGYTFKEWNTKSNGKGVTYAEGAEVQNLTAASKGKVTLYAIWRANSYTIKFEGNGAKSGEMPAQAAVYGSNVKLSANAFVRPGFSFAGWSVDETGKVKYKDKASVKNLCTEDGDSITLKAVWTTNTYTVKFSANGGKGTLPEQLKGVGDTELDIPENSLTFAGYSFREWNTKADGTGDAYNPGDMVVFNTKNKATVTLYAVWTYKATLKDGESEIKDYELTYGKSETVEPEEFTKTGYYIAGWNKDAVKAAKGTIQYKVNAVKNAGPDATLYAVWKPISYTIKFDANGGTGKMSNLSMTYGTAKALTANKYKMTGYTFKGWNTEPDGTGTEFDNKDKITTELTPTVNKQVITLYAVWE